jgi:hypothetical protein
MRVVSRCFGTLSVPYPKKWLGLALHASSAEHNHNQGLRLGTACGTWSIEQVPTSGSPHIVGKVGIVVQYCTRVVPYCTYVSRHTSYLFCV